MKKWILVVWACLCVVNLMAQAPIKTLLGHAGESVEHSPAMQCTGFQVTLLRGAEWAATGEVTQPVPADFPTAQQATFRMEYKIP